MLIATQQRRAIAVCVMIYRAQVILSRMLTNRVLAQKDWKLVEGVYALIMAPLTVILQVGVRINTLADLASLSLLLRKKRRT